MNLLGQIQQKAFDVLQQDNLPLDSLLAAIARFSLQTSARNQFFGTVIERDHQQVQQHISLLLADGHTRLTAAVTQQSADRLQLTPGKEVLALIKAPWVKLSTDRRRPAWPITRCRVALPAFSRVAITVRFW